MNTKQNEDVKLQYPPEEVTPGKYEYPAKGYDVSVTVERIDGVCPYLSEGDVFEYSGDFTDPNEMCGIAETQMFPYMFAMTYGVTAKQLGISKKGEDAGYLCCAAWGPPTCEARCVFRLEAKPAHVGGLSTLDIFYEFLARMGHHSCPSYFMENFSPDEAKKERGMLIEEWDKAGRPLFWEKWRDCRVQKYIAAHRETYEEFEALFVKNKDNPEKLKEELDSFSDGIVKEVFEDFKL